MSCEKCEYLMELFENTSKSNRDYWLATELFIMLHDGFTFCSEYTFQQTEMVRIIRS